jgi:hypothetical protein
MLRDFMEFLRAVWKEWVVLLTGGSLMAVLALYQVVSGKPAPQNILWSVVALTLIIAAFLAWRKEWIASVTGSPVHIDAAKIVRPYWDRTKIQADIYAKQYLGRHVRVRGILNDVSMELFSGFVQMKTGEVSIIASLSRWRMKPFLPLQSGALVTVVGRIDRISALGISLTNCEFIKVEEVPDPTNSN